MTKLLWTILTLLVSSTSFAAIPEPQTECRDMKRPTKASQLQNLNPQELVWDCIDLSALAKTELLQVANTAPSLRLQLSSSNLNRNDLLDLHRVKPVTLDVDSTRFSRLDVVAFQQAGMKVILKSNTLNFNVNDYREIARAGSVTLELGTSSLTPAELRSLAAEPNLTLVIDTIRAGLSSADQQEIVRIAPQTKVRF